MTLTFCIYSCRSRSGWLPKHEPSHSTEVSSQEERTIISQISLFCIFMLFENKWPGHSLSPSYSFTPLGNKQCFKSKSKFQLQPLTGSMTLKKLLFLYKFSVPISKVQKKEFLLRLLFWVNESVFKALKIVSSKE